MQIANKAQSLYCQNECLFSEETFKTESNIKNVELLKEQQHIFTASNRLCMSLHREHYVTQSDLHQTVFFPHHHTWKRLSRATRSCLAPCRKSDTGERKKTTVSVCQQGCKKELSFQHLQTNRWMTLYLKMQLLWVSWSRLSALHTSYNAEHYERIHSFSGMNLTWSQTLLCC